MSEIKTIGDLLIWLSGPGAVIAVSWALSWAFEGWDKWANFPSRAKSLIIVVVSMLIGILATWLQTRPEFLDVIAPYMQTLIAIVLAWLTTQVAHKKNPDRE